MVHHLSVTQQDLIDAVINSQTADPFCIAAARRGLQDVRLEHVAVNPHEPAWFMTIQQDGVRHAAKLPQAAVTWRRALVYEDRFQVLPCKKTSAGDYVEKPFELTLTFQEIPSC